MFGSRGHIARSSSAICDGPSSPIDTPACEPAILMFDVADRRHADEIGGARQEAGEGRRKRNRAARRQPHRRADHRLLGDEYLIEAIRVRLLELVAEGRVLHVGVERDDARVGRRRAWRSRCRTPRASRPCRRSCRPAARPAPAARRGRGGRPARGISARGSGAARARTAFRARPARDRAPRPS